jgi:hypothetical protein
VVFLALLRTGGPLIGLVLYAVLLRRWWQRDYRAAAVGGPAGLAVHVVEVVTMGWSAYPVLMALNLILPDVALAGVQRHPVARAVGVDAAIGQRPAPDGSASKQPSEQRPGLGVDWTDRVGHFDPVRCAAVTGRAK